MTHEALSAVEPKMQRATEAMERDFAGIRTGRASTALVDPASTPLGQSVETLAKAHPGLSGLRLFASGSDCLASPCHLARSSSASSRAVHLCAGTPEGAHPRSAGPSG